MKTQKTLLIVGMAMTLSMATGCKNSSKSAPIVSPDTVAGPAITQEVTQEQTKLEIAVQLKESADLAYNGLTEAQNALKAAKDYRDDVAEARAQEGSAVVRERLSIQVEASIIQVQDLEKNVELATDLLVARRKLLNEALKEISAEERAKLGEAEAEYQMSYNESEARARAEMAMEIAREQTKTAEAKVQELNERLKIAEEELARIESAAGQIPQEFIELERRNIANLIKDIDDANKMLAINMANEDNEAKRSRNLSF